MLSVLILGFLFVCQTSSLSVLTDDKPKSEDTKNDLTRQLLNQETLIRLDLDRKVHDLMRDMADMKTTADSNNKQMQEEIKEANKEILALKYENSALKAELQLQSNKTTLISADLRTTSSDLANIKTKMADMKTKMADMKTNTDSKNKQLEEEITDAKKEVLALKHENSALKAELQLQSNKTTLISANLRTTINTIEQSQKAQQELSSAVLALEVFQKNMSSLSSSRSGETRVGFTAGVTSPSDSWQGDILVFPHVVTNTGNCYSTNTGKFTAPRAGTYVFFVTAVSYSRNYLHLDIVHNGAGKVRTMSDGSAPYQTGTNLAVLELSQGDTVWVRRYTGQGYYTMSVPWTTFSGFLL